MRHFAKIAFLGFLLAQLPAQACADRFIRIPIGRKIPYGTIRFEASTELSRSRETEYFLGIGVSTAFDLAIRSSRLDPDAATTAVDVSYNFIAPVPGLTPGVSVGMEDVLDKSAEGRRGYLAITYRPSVDTMNGEFVADVHFGFTAGRDLLPFVGVMLPFTREFRFLTEHDGRRLAAGFEVRPVRTLGLRILFQEGSVLGGINYAMRF